MKTLFENLPVTTPRFDTGTNVTADEDDYNWVILSLFPLVILVATGNLFVIIAVYLDRKLHSPTNYFLTSLAVADLLVALTVMPPSIAMIFCNYVWPFPQVACALWLMLDVFFSSASILHLCMLSFDRYIALSRPFKSSQKIMRYVCGGRMGRIGSEGDGKRRTLLKIMIVWLAALGISAPLPVIGMHNPEYILQDQMCSIYSAKFAIFGSIVAFFLPLVVMIVVYSLTIRILQKQAQVVSGMLATTAVATMSHPAPPYTRVISTQHCTKTNHLINQHFSRTDELEVSRSNAFTRHEDELIVINENSKTRPCGRFKPRSPIFKGKRDFQHRGNTVNSISQAKATSIRRRTIVSINNERRASKALGLIFTLFCLFWCPFFLTNFISRLCSSCNKGLMYKLLDWFVWVGYASSGINPIVYTMFSKQFRSTFFKMLHCKCSTISDGDSNRRRIVASSRINTK